MKGATTIQERLWDLRKEKGLNLEELAAATKISKSALGSYENDDYKEISHKNLVMLADFYGVSTDYLLCRTENRNHSDTELTKLHISDDMVELLKSGRINNRLLCEIATHAHFIQLMTDAEIFVDGIATMRFQDMNAALETVRTEIIQKYQSMEEETTLKALLASQICEEDYFCHITHKKWDAILHDIRVVHEKDVESASSGSNALKIIADAQKAMHFPGNALDKFCYVMCSQLQINYEKLTDKERTDLKNVMEKSGIYKNTPLGKRKRK